MELPKPTRIARVYDLIADALEEEARRMPPSQKLIADGFRERPKGDENQQARRRSGLIRSSSFMQRDPFMWLVYAAAFVYLFKDSFCGD